MKKPGFSYTYLFEALIYNGTKLTSREVLVYLYLLEVGHRGEGESHTSTISDHCRIPVTVVKRILTSFKKRHIMDIEGGLRGAFKFVQHPLK